MNFDGTITIGNLLTLIGFVGGGFMFMATMRADLRVYMERMDNFDSRLLEMRTQIGKMSDVLTQLALQEQRIGSISKRVEMLDQRYEELRHGEGFIYPLKFPPAE